MPILEQPYRIQLDVKMPMRDGVLLSGDIYRPPQGSVFPALLIRTIYDKQQPRYMDWCRGFLEKGYAVVMQDCRGRHDSDGKWEPYVHEADDGHDTIEWIGKQPWCDGNVGTFGISYVGFTQTLPAPQRSQYLKALAPIASQQDNFGHFYVDGALQLHIVMFFMNMAGRTMKRGATDLMNWDELWRRLPLSTAIDDIVDLPYYKEVLRHHTYDEFWKSFSLRDRYDEVDTPAYFISGWYDNLLHEAFKLYEGWSRHALSEASRRNTKLLIGPWSHQNIGSAEPFGNIDFGGVAKMDIVEEQSRWFDIRLKGIDNGMDDEPPINIFVMGENVWRGEHEWPLQRTSYTNFYLHSQGRANSLHGNGSISTAPPGNEPSDQYTYDPHDPVPTLGGPFMLLENSGPWDHRAVERRGDVLVYTSEPLTQDLEVTGPITIILFAATDAPDTDFTGTLVDVHPDGKAIVLCEGLLRTRFRDSIERPELIRPGDVHEFKINVWETSNLFKAGHRIRLEISSSNFPRFDRNPNTGHEPNIDDEMRSANQTIFHDHDRPSHVVLPVIPRQEKL